MMWKLLRLPLFRSLRTENSRNPGLRPSLMLISPMLSVFSGLRLPASEHLAIACR